MPAPQGGALAPLLGELAKIFDFGLRGILRIKPVNFGYPAIDGLTNGCSFCRIILESNP
jgi:hypothetical protein